MNDKTNKRGRPRLDPAGRLAVETRVSVTGDAGVALQHAQEVLASRLGFQPTVTQTIMYMVKQLRDE